MISAPHGYVTQGPWGVSYETEFPSTAKSCATLFVYRAKRGGSCVGVHGDHYGRRFATAAEANAFAASRGYLVPYFRSKATWKARHRGLCRYWGHVLYEYVRQAETRERIDTLARMGKAWALAKGCELLDAGMFSLAVYSMAHKLRPDLMAR